MGFLYHDWPYLLISNFKNKLKIKTLTKTILWEILETMKKNMEI